MTRYERLSLGLQVLLFAVGIWLACIYRGQLQEMIKQSGASKTSADAARDAYEAAYRAWVLWVADTVDVRFAADEPGPGTMRVKNWGGGIAKNVWGNTKITSSANRPDDPPPAPEFPPDTPVLSRGVIAPQGEQSINFTVDPIGPDAMAAVPTKTLTLFLFGFIRYEDAFSADRETTYCMWYKPEPAATKAGGLTQGKWNLCPRGNVVR